MNWIKDTYNAAALKVDGLQGTEMEKQVKEATSNANWGVAVSLKNSIADGTHDYQQFREIMGVLWKRMSDKNGTNWRIVYKSLDLLMHCIKFGHDRVVEDVRDHQIVLRPLSDFHYFDPQTGNDRGRGIRTLTKQILDLLKDTQALNKLRNDARVQRVKQFIIPSHIIYSLAKSHLPISLAKTRWNKSNCNVKQWWWIWRRRRK